MLGCWEKHTENLGGYGTGIVSDNPEITEKEKVRASAERLGIDTAGMDTSEIKNAMLDKLSNE